MHRIVTAGQGGGGCVFKNELETRSSRATRKTIYENIIALHAIVASDTYRRSFRTRSDGLVILLAHFHRMQCNHLWMKSGTSRKRNIFRYMNLPVNYPANSAQALIPCHA